MQTEVLVPDGGTTVIGGVLTDLESEARSSTPGLSRIPILGNLFRNRTTQRNTNEILFFITPRIYRPDFAGNQTSGKVGDSTRSTTLVQPVPLGNPPTNSDMPGGNPTPQQPVVQPIVIPVSPSPNQNDGQTQPKQP